MAVQLQSVLPVAEFRGSPRACGRGYGEVQAEAMRALLTMEVRPNRWRLRLAACCWQELGRWEKPVAEFVRGLAEGSGLTPAETTLLLLHEEIVHSKHCTALGATGPGTRDGRAIIGQNWDWASPLTPWPGLLRLRTNAMPATITYGYPGLWAAAGINEHGLALMWTSAGYRPKVAPLVGIPTYALIAGVLSRRTCREAIDLVERTPFAGCFIFFLADAAGEVWVLEAGGGRLEVVPCADVIGRANHYETAALRRFSRQRIPPDNLKENTRSRGRRMAELLRKHRGRIGPRTVESILCDHGRPPGLNICQHPLPGRHVVTIDSFYARPDRREFWIARGHPCRHRYERHPVLG
ncbi:MAG: hypothetical protein JNG83_00060 [Opitutaceae bacterium]|nr:hypothetical protein [Opitutaceae bacterium]